MAPSSYQAPMRGDAKAKSGAGQSHKTDIAADPATVRKLIGQKGNEVATISPQDTIGHAVKVLSEKKIGSLVVTDAQGAIKGILSEHNIVRKLAETPGQTLPQKVEENMNTKVQVCSLDDTLVAVLNSMSQGRFRHMPVVEDGKLCGLLSIGDLVNFRLQELEYESLKLKQIIVG